MSDTNEVYKTAHIEVWLEQKMQWSNFQSH